MQRQQITIRDPFYLHGKDVVSELVSKDKLCPDIGVGEELACLLSKEAEDLVAHVPLEDERRKAELEDESTDHRPPVHLVTEGWTDNVIN